MKILSGLGWPVRECADRKLLIPEATLSTTPKQGYVITTRMNRHYGGVSGGQSPKPYRAAKFFVAAKSTVTSANTYLQLETRSL